MIYDIYIIIYIYGSCGFFLSATVPGVFRCHDLSKNLPQGFKGHQPGVGDHCDVSVAGDAIG